MPDNRIVSDVAVPYVFGIAGLTGIQRQELGDKTLESVLKTNFGVRATETGFEYYVIDIKYR